MIEIERKFLIKKEEWELFVKNSNIEYSYDCVTQAYFPRNNDFSQRVRVINNKAYLTIKTAAKKISRVEFECEIPFSEAWEMIEVFCKQRILSKLRYSIIFESKKWEIDIFLDHFEGLMLAEIELNSEHEQFTKPSFIGDEVTGQQRYYNENLANVHSWVFCRQH